MSPGKRSEVVHIIDCWLTQGGQTTSTGLRNELCESASFLDLNLSRWLYEMNSTYHYGGLRKKREATITHKSGPSSYSIFHFSIPVVSSGKSQAVAAAATKGRGAHRRETSSQVRRITIYQAVQEGPLASAEGSGLGLPLERRVGAARLLNSMNRTFITSHDCLFHSNNKH